MELYKINDENGDRFYRLPKILLMNPYYREKLNPVARELYSILLDRMELSRTHKWVNKNGEIYLMYGHERLAEIMGISRPTVDKAFKALLAAKLVKVERMGCKQPNRIFVAKIPQEAFKHAGCKNLYGGDVKNLYSNDTNVPSEPEKIVYITLPSDDEFIEYYQERFRDRFDKNHMRVTPSQLEWIEEQVSYLRDTLDVSYELWQDGVDEHFRNLPKKNNGNILAFLKAAYRYLENAHTNFM